MASSAPRFPLGTGLAFANKYRGNDNVSLTYLGDGAANQGQVYRSFNMASCVSFRSSTSLKTSVRDGPPPLPRASATINLSQRGRSFDIPGEQIDGMDVRAGKAAGDKAVKWCRDGNGPIILEMLTYRYRGHSMSDPAKYRSKEEVDKVRTEHDPIETGAQPPVEAGLCERRLFEEDRCRSTRPHQRSGPNSPAATRSPIRPSSWSNVYAE